MSSTAEITVSPAHVKAGERISVLGPVGAVSRIWIKDIGLTAFAGSEGVDAIVTSEVPLGGWQVSVTDPDDVRTYVGGVIVDAAK